MNRTVKISVGVVGALLAFGAYNAATHKTPAAQPAATSSSPAATAPAATTAVTTTAVAVKPATKPAASKTSTAPRALTGFGATQTTWDAHHTADPDTSGYNPDPGLPPTPDGKTSDDYTAVTTDPGGHVYGYFLGFTARPLAAALDRVKQELPADAKLTAPVVTSGIADSKCLIVTATSPTLGTIMGGSDGAVVSIELQSASPTVLDQGAISDAALVSGNAGSAPGC